MGGGWVVVMLVGVGGGGGGGGAGVWRCVGDAPTRQVVPTNLVVPK